jgi:hypothetical protein
MRRLIFLLMALAIFIPIMQPLNLPGLRATEPTEGIFNSIESLPNRSPILISFDFDPGSRPELNPMSIAIITHAFEKNLRVIGMGLWLPGIGNAEEIMTTTAARYNKEYGKDYVFLGWQPDAVAVITNLGVDFYKAFPKDYRGQDIQKMEVMKGINSIKDVGYMFCCAAGDPGIEAWVAYGADKYGFKMGGGCTGVIAPGIRPFYATKQITGLLGGMKGAAEYELLLKKRGTAIPAMDSISLGHFLIIIFIILGNIIYFRKKKEA